jgi:hypothetical protein
VIATHSPILMAYPGALIYALSERGVEPVEYRETAHFRTIKSFVDAPEATLEELLTQSGREPEEEQARDLERLRLLEELSRELDAEASDEPESSRR